MATGDRTDRVLSRLSLTEARALILTVWAGLSLVIGWDVLNPSIFVLDWDGMSIFPMDLTAGLWIIAGMFGLGCVLVADHNSPSMALPLGFGVLVFMPALTAAACWSIAAAPTALMWTGITLIVGISSAVVWPPRVRSAWKRGR
jgi:hypothetical protein